MKNVFIKWFLIKVESEEDWMWQTINFNIHNQTLVNFIVKFKKCMISAECFAYYSRAEVKVVLICTYEKFQNY